jgi:hypothetical protein
MRSSKWTRRAVVQGLILAVGVGTAYADAPAPKWYDSTSISGYIQGTYIGILGKETSQLRPFDPNEGFGLPQAQLKISKPVADDSAGFVLKFLTGTNAQVIHSAGGNSDTNFDVEEANMTFNVPKVKGLTFTGGKFVTACGVEVIESPSNLMIEPGLLFFYGMPFTNTGGKFNYTVNDKLSLSAGVVNGWDNVTDGNSGKTVIWQASVTPPVKGLSASFQGSYGPELFGSNTTPAASGNNNISKRTHTDFVVNYAGIDKLSLNAEYLWGQDSNTAGVANSGTTVWSGAGLWATYAVSDYINPGVRFEVFNDQNGTNGANRLVAGVPETAKDIALVNKFVVNKNTALRLEYRHDFSNAAVYARNNGSLVRNQNTISADWVVTF